MKNVSQKVYRAKSIFICKIETLSTIRRKEIQRLKEKERMKTEVLRESIKRKI